ncbi:unnamed protein product, partial [Closterium sp. NIES-53]
GLHSNNLSGSIPPSIASLSLFNALWVQYCHFQSSILLLLCLATCAATPLTTATLIL